MINNIYKLCLRIYIMFEEDLKAVLKDSKKMQEAVIKYSSGKTFIWKNVKGNTSNEAAYLHRFKKKAIAWQKLLKTPQMKKLLK